MTATESCFAFNGAHQRSKAVELMNGENPPYCRGEFKTVIKRQLHTTHVGAVGWEPHSSSAMACAGKVDH